ncbi:MAG: hypothetical protein EAX90_06005 [Candidatus Heimdallarchaeota archaeon]|nr:hypothetical protein [Candidatus Heimdallarchaeota archaeon]
MISITINVRIIIHNIDNKMIKVMKIELPPISKTDKIRKGTTIIQKTTVIMNIILRILRNVFALSFTSSSITFITNLFFNLINL